MGITSGDIKLIASQVMDDVPEGGGPPSGNVIPDGVSNGIFPDISEVARAGGKVYIRKLFLGVQTPNTDAYFDANLIVAEPYKDPRVSVTLFTTGSTFDRRTDIADRMESYLAKGPVYPGYLFGDHIAGQMTVTLLQREEAELPNVGQTLVLRKNQSLPTQVDEYVRVTAVAATMRTFADAYDSTGEFKRRQVVLDISNPLSVDFPGFDAIRLDAQINYTGKTKAFDTVVADASRYYGVVGLKNAAAIGDFTIQAKSVYSQLVPSTRVETPLADARMNQQSATLTKAGEAFTRTLSMVFTTAQAMYVGGGVLPGSYSVTRNGVTLTDKAGLLVDSSGNQVGLADCANGVFSLSTNVFGTSAGDHTVTYTPASAPVLVTDTLGLPVTALSQRLSWTVTLPAPPAAATLSVSYRALGRWYVLTDDGTGAVRGADSSFGAGSLNSTTATLSVTLGAMPDIGSRIILAWASPASTVPLPPPPPPPAPAPAPGAPAPAPTDPAPMPAPHGVLEMQVPLQSPDFIYKPSTLVLTWNDGTARTASAPNGAQLTGDATGAVVYGASGFPRYFNFRPNVLPPKGTVVTVAVDKVTAQHDIAVTMSDEGSTFGFSLPAGTPATGIALKLTLTIPMRRYPGTDSNVQVQGSAYIEAGGTIRPSWIVLGQAYPGGTSFSIGSYNPATGVGHISKTAGGYPSYQPTFTNDGGAIVQSGSGMRSVTAAISPALTGTYMGAETSTPAPTWTFTADLFTADVVPPVAAAPAGAGATSPVVNVASATVGSGAAAITYHWSPTGELKTGVSPTTGTGTTAGSVSGGTLTLTDWPAGQSSTLTGATGTITPAVTPNPNAAIPGSAQVCGAATLRTAISPLVSGGFSVAGAWLDGPLLNAIADADGHILTAGVPITTPEAAPGTRGVVGVVDYENGIADLRFGRRVPDSMAGQTGVVDVTALGLPGINYMLLEGVQSSTLRYNAVGYSYLPLDPAILGLNPVRLPADGRVPIFRPGGFVVLGHTGKIGPAAVTNGQTIDCARVRLSRVRVIGSDGLVINTGYTADLDLGLVQIVDTTGWSQPVTIEHRIEDMMMVRDVQINGQLSFTRPVTHAYPADTAYVSSALIGGDLHARAKPAFNQQTWTSVWSDVPIGSPAGGTFNDAQNPITVTNDGALTERWACIFTSTTSFVVRGEHVGVIASGNTGSDCAPLNPSTGQPYFRIPAAGWGLGWAVGNVMRFDTVGALLAFDCVRTVLQGPETVTDDDFLLLGRGDVDKP